MDGPPRWWRMAPLILAILLAGALGLILYLADHADNERSKALGWQRHSFEVMMLAEQLDGTLSSSEALLARYVVSLDKTVGRQFREEWRTALAQANALERATRDNAEQQENIRALKAAIDERGKTLNDIALRTTYNQRLGALGRLYAAGRSPTITRINHALKRTIEREQFELERRNQEVNRSEQRVSLVYDSYSMIGIAILAVALLTIWFAYGAFRERLFARQLAASEAARVDGLEQAVRERTAELEQANARLQREMDERAQAEQSLRQLQKMEAVGNLTGGIAHDFNNMLAVIVSGIELGMRALKSDIDKAGRHLANAMDGAERAAALTRRLLTFARPSQQISGKVDIDGLVEGMLPLIDRAIEEGISLKLDLDGGGWSLRTESALLENAILNLVINARDAMGGRGTLTIATRHASLDAREIGQCAAGDHVILSVSDTGSGMTPDVIERIFEPFFTTKPVGKGTGLGLSLIFSFVNGAGGEIDIDSTPGEGTTFRLILPRDEAEAAADPQGVAALPTGDAVMAPADGETILVVEDDSRVLKATIDGLAALGYLPIPCDHPGKAARLLETNPDIVLIVSDVLMPDMTGPELRTRLEEVRPDLPFVFVTGFAGQSEQAAMASGAPILRKPFTQDQLARTVAGALAAARPAPPAASVQ